MGGGGVQGDWREGGWMDGAGHTHPAGRRGGGDAGQAARAGASWVHAMCTDPPPPLSALPLTLHTVWTWLIAGRGTTVLKWRRQCSSVPSMYLLRGVDVCCVRGRGGGGECREREEARQ